MKIKINIPRVDYFQQKQSEPTLHVYLLNCGNNSVHTVSLDWEHFNKVFELPRMCLGDGLVSGNAVLAFDLYVKIKNSEGVWCRMHRASGNVFLKNAQTQLTRLTNSRNSTIRYLTVPIGNVWTNTCVGNIAIDFEDTLHVIDFNDDVCLFENPQLEEQLQTRMTKLIRGEMQLFQGASVIKSKNAFIKRVHAPIFNGRESPMPGFAYLMNSHSFRGDLLWYLHWYTNARKRIGIGEDEIIALVEKQFNINTAQIVEGFHTITLLLATLISSSVTCYPYECDFYVEDGEQKAFESFDNVFVRKSGDCEDFGRGMHFVFSTFCAMDIPDTSIYTGLLAIQNVGKLYLSGVVLGTVSQNSHGVSIMKTRQAHMYVQLFPVQQFTERIKVVPDYCMEQSDLPTIDTNVPPWTRELRVYTVEGTAPVQPFTSLMTMHADLDVDKQSFEQRSARLPVPHGMVREYRPTWGVFEDPFYKTECHVYTDYFIELGFGIGSFALYDTKCNVYGVPMQKVLNMENTVFIPHQIITTEDVQAIKTLLVYEHPMPPMTVSCLTGKQWICNENQNQNDSGSGVNTVINEFVKRLRVNSKKEASVNRSTQDVWNCDKNKNYGEQRTQNVANGIWVPSLNNTGLYNDFFIQTPAQLSLTEMHNIVVFLEQRTMGHEVFIEGADPEEMIIRVRAYGLVG